MTAPGEPEAEREPEGRPPARALPTGDGEVPDEGADAEGVGAAEAEPGSGRDRRTAWQRWRLRLAPLVLVGGLSTAFVIGKASLPDKRTLTVRLTGDREDIRQVTVVVTSPADPDDELTSVLWRFGEGAPRSVRTEVRLPDGDHRFHVEVMANDGNQVETDRVVKVLDNAVTIEVPTH